MVKLISKNEGGYAIGLEGSWESGKSTVINIAEDKLEGKGEEILFFPFDAWARQGDYSHITYPDGGQENATGQEWRPIPSQSKARA